MTERPPYEDVVRSRPAMYIGDLHDGSGLGRMLSEVVAFNLRGELGGQRSFVSVRCSDGAIEVVHWVEGPADSARIAAILEGALTGLASDTSYDDVTHSNGGAEGVGIVRALCDTFTVTLLGGEVQKHIGFAAGRRVESAQMPSAVFLSFQYVPDMTVFQGSQLDLEAIGIQCSKMRVSRPTTLVLTDGKRIDVFDLQVFIPEDPKVVLESETEKRRSLREKFLEDGIKLVKSEDDGAEG